MKSHEEMIASVFKFAVMMLLVTSVLYKFQIIDLWQYVSINVLDAILETAILFWKENTGD